jgi:hypothetical protein
MGNLDLHYFLHGLIILMIGQLGGYPFAKAIKKKNGREVAWRVVHSGSSVAGIMLIAIGGLINRLSVSSLTNSLILWGIVISTYLLVIGMIIAAVSGERGIGNSKEEHNGTWKIVYYLYGFGAFIPIISLGILIFACLNNLLA